MMTRTPISIIIVDDHPVLRAGLCTVSEVDSDIVIIGEAGSAAEALQVVDALEPDLVLLDACLPDKPGDVLCAEIKRRKNPPRVLFLSSFADEELVLRGIKAGADGYLLKGSDQREIAQAIHKVMRGGIVFDPTVARNVFAAHASRELTPRQRLAALSPQELRVIEEVALGKTDKEVAAVIGLTPKTVRNYLDRAFGKLSVSTRTEAAALWFRSKLPQS